MPLCRPGRALQDKPVLTVGEVPRFLQEGGIVRFQVADRVEMRVNLDQARSASLRCATRRPGPSERGVEDYPDQCGSITMSFRL